MVLVFVGGKKLVGTSDDLDYQKCDIKNRYV